MVYVEEQKKLTTNHIPKQKICTSETFPQIGSKKSLKCELAPEVQG